MELQRLIVREFDKGANYLSGPILDILSKQYDVSTFKVTTTPFNGTKKEIPLINVFNFFTLKIESISKAIRDRLLKIKKLEVATLLIKERELLTQLQTVISTPKKVDRIHLDILKLYNSYYHC